MGFSDGWVAERISFDHTAIPDLSDARAPVSKAGFFDESLVANSAPVMPEPVVEELSDGSNLLFRTLAVVGLVLALVAGWPVISSLLADAEPIAEVTAANEPTQRFVISEDKMYLEGSVPDEATSRRIEDAAQQALGVDRVINNFEISDQAFFDPNQPVSLNVSETVQFVSGTAQVAPEYEPLIDLAVQLMVAQPDATLSVTGHTDDRGEEEANAKLSLDRAEAVAAEITARGVVQARLKVEGRGETEPIASNDSPEGRSTNRRVEFLLSGLLN